MNNADNPDFVVAREQTRLQDISWSSFSTGVLAAVVGFIGSFAVVLQGLKAAGATEAQAASGLIALTIGMGITGIILPLRYRIPVGIAWSTPGAALLIASADTLNNVNEAIGAYLFSALLLMVAGWFRPLGRLIESIPAKLANAMLAGVLLSICLAPVRALAVDVWMAAPLLFTWWLVGRFNRPLAVPCALLVLIPVVIWRVGLPADFSEQIQASLMPHLMWITPSFEPQALISIGIPLFVVTMASQNVPGVAVLRASGYELKAGPFIMGSGFASVITAPFGAHAINLAAITAALFCSKDAHENPDRRYWSAVFAGLTYVVLGVFAGVAGLVVTIVPVVVVEAVAGLALLGSFSSAIVAALGGEENRDAAAITFLFAASGVAFLGVGGAFWGLIVGGVMYVVSNRKSSL